MHDLIYIIMSEIKLKKGAVARRWNLKRGGRRRRGEKKENI